MRTFNKKPWLLSFDYPADNRIIAGEAGAIEVVAKAMNEHIKNGDVCKNGCGALWNITRGNGKQEPTQRDSFCLPFKRPADNAIKAGKKGAIEAIVNAMNEHIKNGDVCKNGCDALWNITRGNGKQEPTQSPSFCSQFKRPDDNRIKAGEAGAIEAIVNAIKTHINNGDICENGCGALMSITYKNGKLGTTNQMIFLIQLIE